MTTPPGSLCAARDRANDLAGARAKKDAGDHLSGYERMLLTDADAMEEALDAMFASLDPEVTDD